MTLPKIKDVSYTNISASASAGDLTLNVNEPLRLPTLANGEIFEAYIVGEDGVNDPFADASYQKVIITEINGDVLTLENPLTRDVADNSFIINTRGERWETDLLDRLGQNDSDIVNIETIRAEINRIAPTLFTAGTNISINNGVISAIIPDNDGNNVATTYSFTINGQELALLVDNVEVSTITLPTPAPPNLTPFLIRIMAVETALTNKLGYVIVEGGNLDFYENENAYDIGDDPISSIEITDLAGNGGNDGEGLTPEQVMAIARVAINQANIETNAKNITIIRDKLNRVVNETDNTLFTDIVAGARTNRIELGRVRTGEQQYDIRSITDNPYGDGFQVSQTGINRFILLSEPLADNEVLRVIDGDGISRAIYHNTDLVSDPNEWVGANAGLRTPQTINFGAIYTIKIQTITQQHSEALNPNVRVSLKNFTPEEQLEIKNTTSHATSADLQSFGQLLDVELQLGTTEISLVGTAFYKTGDFSVNLDDWKTSHTNARIAEGVNGTIRLLIPNSSNIHLTRYSVISPEGNEITGTIAVDNDNVLQGYTAYTFTKETRLGVSLLGREIIASSIVASEKFKIVFNSLPQDVKDKLNLFTQGADGTYNLSSNAKIGTDNLDDILQQTLNSDRLSADDRLILEELFLKLEDVEEETINVENISEVGYDLDIASDRTATEAVDKINIDKPDISGEDNNNYFFIPTNEVNEENAILSFGVNINGGKGYEQFIFQWGSFQIFIRSGDLIIHHGINKGDETNLGSIENGYHIFAVALYQQGGDQKAEIARQGEVIYSGTLGLNTLTGNRLCFLCARTDPTASFNTHRPVIEDLDFTTYSNEIINEDSNAFLNDNKAGYFGSETEKRQFNGTGNGKLWGIYDIQEISVSLTGDSPELVVRVSNRSNFIFGSTIEELVNIGAGFTTTGTFEDGTLAIGTIGQIGSPTISFETNRYGADGVNDETRIVAKITDGTPFTINDDDETVFTITDFELEGHTDFDDLKFWANNNPESVDVEITQHYYNGFNSLRLLGNINWLTIFRMTDTALLTDAILQRISSVKGSSLYTLENTKRLAFPKWEELEATEIEVDIEQDDGTIEKGTENHYTITADKDELYVQITLTQGINAGKKIRFRTIIPLNEITEEVGEEVIASHNPSVTEFGQGAVRSVAFDTMIVSTEPNGDKVVRIRDTADGSNTEITSVQAK